MKNPIHYIKEKGIRRAWFVFYHIKCDIIQRKILYALKAKKKLQNIIIIESHNDFDCNGGALYDYMIKEKVNKKYRIVWLVKNRIPTNLPENVICFKLNKPNWKKNKMITLAKYLFFDECFIENCRSDQIVIYLTHGGITFKNVKGKIVIPEHISYILSPSKSYDKIMCENYSIPYPNNRMLHFGMPKNDCLFNNNDNSKELSKLTDCDYDNVFLWMPTFRRMAGTDRNDSCRDYPFGLPLISSQNEFIKLSNYLIKINSFLIIKLHPNQDLTQIISIPQYENIIILSDNKCKEMGINTYKLMSSATAMISDYSSSAYSYLLLDRPIAFTLDDLQDYERGFVVEDFKKILPGELIYTIGDLLSFFANVSNDFDKHAEARSKMLDWLYDYKDGNSCKRLLEFLSL